MQYPAFRWIINGEDTIAKSSEKYTSVKIGCLKLLDSHWFLDGSLNKVSTTLTSFPFLEANGIEDDLFKRKLAHSYEKGETSESFYEPMKLRR